VRFIRFDAPEFRDLELATLYKTVTDDVLDKRYFEKHDPLKGNSIAVMDYLDGVELLLFSTGPSMSNLGITCQLNESRPY
jgi:hypothetical protein